MIVPLLYFLIFAQAPSGSGLTVPSTTQPAAPARPPAGRYIILKVEGDLDTDNFLRGITAELDRARGVPLVILELNGNQARQDLVARLGARISAGEPAIAVLLKDAGDRRVGVGQVLLGGFARHCFIDPETKVASADDIRYLAPAETQWESIEQNITGPLWRRLTDLGADQTLPQLLISPSKDMWAVPVRPGEPWKLSASVPAGGQAGPQPRQVAWSEGARIDIDPEAAVGLRLCTDKAASFGPILAASGLSPRSTGSRRTVESRLPGALQDIARTLDDAKLAVRRISTTLTLKSTPTVPSAEDYRRAGKSALDQIDRVARELDRAELLLSEFPELNRRRDSAPGRTDKGPWRPVIEDLRKGLDKNRTTARDFASR